MIHDIDLSGYTGKAGELIRVQAVDNFELLDVTLVLTQMDGTLIEVGTAVLGERSSLWTYVTQAAVPGGQAVVLHATAVDRPGNAVTKTLHHALMMT